MPSGHAVLPITGGESHTYAASQKARRFGHICHIQALKCNLQSNYGAVQMGDWATNTWNCQFPYVRNVPSKGSDPLTP